MALPHARGNTAPKLSFSHSLFGWENPAARTDAPENDLVASDLTLAQRGRRGAGGEIEPRDILYAAAAFASEVMMRVQIGIEPRRSALAPHFPDQTGFSERVKVVVDCGPGCPRIAAVYRMKDLFRRSMDIAAGQKFEHGITLCRRPQRRRPECLVELFRILRHSLYLE